MHKNLLVLKLYLESVKKRCSRSSKQELTEIILGLAKEVPAKQRPGFLEAIDRLTREHSPGSCMNRFSGGLRRSKPRSGNEAHRSRTAPTARTTTKGAEAQDHDYHDELPERARFGHCRLRPAALKTADWRMRPPRIPRYLFLSGSGAGHSCLINRPKLRRDSQRGIYNDQIFEVVPQIPSISRNQAIGMSRRVGPDQELEDFFSIAQNRTYFGEHTFTDNQFSFASDFSDCRHRSIREVVVPGKHVQDDGGVSNQLWASS